MWLNRVFLNYQNRGEGVCLSERRTHWFFIGFFWRCSSNCKMIAFANSWQFWLATIVSFETIFECDRFGEAFEETGNEKMKNKERFEMRKKWKVFAMIRNNSLPPFDNLLNEHNNAFRAADWEHTDTSGWCLSCRPLWSSALRAPAFKHRRRFDTHWV